MLNNPSNPICGPPPVSLRRLVFLSLPVALVALVALTPAVVADWVDFSDQTGVRLDVDSTRGSSDPKEKDYAWGDVDNDGDIDVVVARKQAFTTAGKDPNVLLINENGVLTDRTNDFAISADVPGDEGFNTPTNDRDVALVDIDNDGWLDIITTTAISAGEPKHIGYPRIYHNKGCDAPCNGTADWNGFVFENSRIPEMLSDSGQAGFNPCFCAVAGGDVTGDGYADLWFADYDTACGDADFNNKLLVNRGASQPGYFDDVTETSFSSNYQSSAFGASADIRDFNNDTHNDLIKQFAGHVEIAYNTPTDEGFFDEFDVVFNGAAYFMTVGELNNDGWLDLAIADDGADRYILNQGTGADDVADWVSYTYAFTNTGGGSDVSDDQGFGGNTLIVDLDKDGWNDVLVTDVDVDVSGCGRRMQIYKNLGGSPGDQVTLQEQVSGSGCASFFGNPPTCVIASIAADRLEGVHDVAVFDINGDTWNDMLVGRCSGTEVYINEPPFDPAGGTPDGKDVPGIPLLASKSGTGPITQVQLSWGASCSLGDSDYEIYEGAIGNFDGHDIKFCTTGGATTSSFFAGPGNSYYLVVPANAIVEGSYGKDSLGAERPRGDSVCLPQAIGVCEP